MQKHLAPYTNRAHLSDIQPFNTVQDTVEDVCKILLSCTLSRDYLLAHIRLTAVLFCFKRLKQTVCRLETNCFKALNTLFRYREYFVSRHKTDCLPV